MLLFWLINFQKIETAMPGNTKFYFAPKPVDRSNWLAKLATRVLFPPLLLWDAMKWGTNRLLGATVGNALLGKIFYTEEDLQNARRDLERGINTINEDPDLRADQYWVVTHDGAGLSTLEIRYQNDDNNTDETKYVINFFGSRTLYESRIPEMIDDAHKLKCHVIGFNYRGISQSSGEAECTGNLLIDGIAQVQRILDRKVPPENITLKGESLGGIAAPVALYFQQLGIELNVFLNRTFSNVTNVLVGQVRTNIFTDVPYFENLGMELSSLGNNAMTSLLVQRIRGHRLSHPRTAYFETPPMQLLGHVVKPFIKVGLAMVDWEIEVADAFKQLDPKRTEYIVIKSLKEDRKRRVNKPKDDLMVTDYATLHSDSALRSERRKQKSDPTEGDIAKKRNDARKVVSSSREADAHIVDFSDLRHRSNREGTEPYAVTFFQDFVRRTGSRQVERSQDSFLRR